MKLHVAMTFLVLVALKAKAGASNDVWKPRRSLLRGKNNQTTEDSSSSCTFCWEAHGTEVLHGEYESSEYSVKSTAISADGTVFAIGEADADRVRVFERGDGNSTTWIPRGSPLEGPIGSSFGYAIDISNDGRTIVVGGPTWGTYDGTGIVHIYRWTLPHKVWRLLHEVQGTVDSAYGIYLGKDVAISSSGRTVAMLAPYAWPRIEIYTSRTGDLDTTDTSSEYWSKLSEYQDGYPYADNIYLSGAGSLVAAVREDSVQVLKLNKTDDWYPFGSRIMGNATVVSTNARVMAVVTASTPLLPEKAYSDIINSTSVETTVYKWDETSADWMQWGQTIEGYPVATSFDGFVVAVAVSTSIQIYQNRDGTWVQLGDGVPLATALSNVTVAPSIATNSNGILVAVSEWSGEGIPDESSQGRTTVYSFVDPSGQTIPTPAPTLTNPCSTGSSYFQLEVTTDLSPNDLTWTLRKEGEDTNILEGGPYVDALMTFEYDACIPSDGCYQFRFLDAYQEGPCCLYGEGGFTVSLNSEVIAVYDGSDTAYGSSSIWFGDCPF